MQPEFTFTFTHAGLEFNAYVEADDRNEAPWENEDGHGPVRVVSHSLDGAKRPGERVLHTDGHTSWLYDWQAACAMARTDGWNAAPYDAPGRIERAVTADFKRLRDWLRGEWFYVGVCVTRAGEPASERYAHALWGIESDSPDYHQQVAAELAGDIIAEMSDMEPALSHLD